MDAARGRRDALLGMQARRAADGHEVHRPMAKEAVQVIVSRGLVPSSQGRHLFHVPARHGHYLDAGDGLGGSRVRVADASGPDDADSVLRGARRGHGWGEIISWVYHASMVGHAAASVKRLVVGISGASGTIYGIRLLEVLRTRGDFETHLVISASGKRTLAEETDYTVKDVEALADVVYDNRDIGASPASGSFKTAGMVIVPCSIKTVSALANCYGDTLIARAGDVALKEGRPADRSRTRDSPPRRPPPPDVDPGGDRGWSYCLRCRRFIRALEPWTTSWITTVARILDRLGLRPGHWCPSG